MRVTLKNEQGLIKQCKVGFSWTMLFFNSFVPLFRGDCRWFFTIFFMKIWIFSMYFLLFSSAYDSFDDWFFLDQDWNFGFFLFDFAGFSLPFLILPFIYNRIYIHNLLSTGFTPADEISAQVLRKEEYIL